ncbi:MAG TPA: M20/M25/M40 family metallo-hydrolase [Steroidobacteraceae bacterium]|nr:M20/M25/M40 family metallo-hydrolase [Steroidobacteraceae bacterium]
MKKTLGPSPWAAAACATTVIALGVPGLARPAQAEQVTQTVDPAIASAVKAISPARVQADIEKLVSFGTRSTLSAQDKTAISAGHGIGAAREWLKTQLEAYSQECGGCLEVKTDEFIQPVGARVPQPTTLTNVYAILKGSDPESAKRIVLVTGHYDSRNTNVLDTSGAAPGANDDASGVAVSLESARALSKLKFRATIIFLTVAGEEQGLDGARHFAQMAKEAGWNIEAVLDDDIVGGDKSPGQQADIVRVFSEGMPSAADEKQLRAIRGLGAESDSISRELARYVVEVGGAYSPGVKPLLVFRLDRYLRGGDHSAFNDQGFAAVRFTEYRENFNHQHQDVRSENGIEYGDTLKFVDFGYVARVGRLNAAALAALAAAPAPPPAVKVVTTNLDNNTTLKWGASAGASGYEVIWRETSAPTWEHVKSVGDTTTTTLEISKDNVIFAVRAVDKAGHKSLPVVPAPER